LREAAPADARAIAAVHVLAWQSAYRGLVPDAHLDALSIDRRAELWDQILAAAPGRGQRIWVSGEEINGFVCVGPSRDTDVDPAIVGELQALYLLPSAWGQGIGHLLHQTGMDWLRAQGKCEATLWVLEGNTARLNSTRGRDGAPTAQGSMRYGTRRQ
jgi:GNAT superfamily N-acetyltransferase